MLPKVSVVIPAYNEEKTILQIIKQIIDVKICKQIIIVNDCSLDDTKNLVEQFISEFTPDEYNWELILINNEKNSGRSTSIMNGFSRATGEIIIPQDADLEYDPNDYYELISPIENGETNIVYGSRFKNNENKFYSHIEFYLGNKVLTWFFNVLYFKRMTDVETCYKVIRSNLLKTVDFPLMRRFEFCPYLTSSMAVRGEKIVEVPVKYYPRSIMEGKKAHWKDAVDVIAIFITTRLSNLKREKV